MDKKELSRRGDEIFERRIRPTLGPQPESCYVAIDVDSEDFEVDASELAAIDRLNSRHPSAQIWLRKTDSRFARIFGGMRRPEVNR